LEADVKSVDIHDHLVPALVALDRERPHAILAHVLQRHWLDWIVEARTHRPSRARCIAGLSGFLTLIRSRKGPER